MNQVQLTTYLAKPAIHDAWSNNFRTQANEIFFNLAFDKIVKLCHITPNKKILDAGCGSANHAVRLAKKGLHITGIDFSPSALKMAEDRTEALGLEDKISLSQGDITNLSFTDNYFDVVYSWGVIVHVPDVEAAIKELARVVKPGGYIALSVSNKNSFDVGFLKFVNMLRGRQHKKQKTNSGTENWFNVEDSDSKLFMRFFNTSWIIKEFEKYHVKNTHHVSGQFTESYIYFKNNAIKKAIHFFNNTWFKYLRWPVGAYANILIFQKEE